MRLNVKHLGDELTLDQYNAYQYLLYQMDCWNEEIELNTNTAYTGVYGDYKLLQDETKGTFFINDKQDTYKISRTITSNDNLEIELSNPTPLLFKDHLQFTATLYYQKPTTLPKLPVPSTYDPQTNTYRDENGEIIIDQNGNILRTENVTLDADHKEEVKHYGYDETHKKPKVEEDYKKAIVTCTLIDDVITIPLTELYDEKQEQKITFPVGTLISKKVKFNIRLNSKPYIDPFNGIANELTEILIDNTEDFVKVIENAPLDGTPVLIRLDSYNKNDPYHEQTYKIQETITIKTGQNIIIQGGTRVNPILDGRICKRTFIVQHGASLILNNLTLQNNNCSNNKLYDYGRGGAILVEARRRYKGKHSYGKLECNSCTFTQNQAIYGGAIFSYHSRLVLKDCDFFTNNSQKGGGAVMYWVRDVNLEFPNISVGNGSTIKLKCKITNYKNQKINEGRVTFYYLTEKVDEETNKVITEEETRTVDVENGEAILEDYEVNTSRSQLQFLAKYHGGSTYEDELAKCTVYVVKPEEYTATFVKTYSQLPEKTLTIRVKVVDSHGNVVTQPKGTFTLSGEGITFTTVNAKTDKEFYYINYQVPKVPDTLKSIHMKFSIEQNTYYKCDVVEAELYILNEEEVLKTKKEISGPIYGLFVNSLQPTLVNSVSNIWTDEGVTNELVGRWVNAGFTDIFVRVADYTDNKKKCCLEAVLQHTRDTNLRIHAVVNCYYDVDGLTLKEQWTDVNPTINLRTQHIQRCITGLLQNTDVDGICLDYMMFQGEDTYSVTEKVNRHTEINKALQTISSKVHDMNPRCYLSSMVEAETDAGSLYGQNFKEMIEYVDFLIPKAFKSKYNTSILSRTVSTTNSTNNTNSTNTTNNTNTSNTSTAQTVAASTQTTNTTNPTGGEFPDNWVKEISQYIAGIVGKDKVITCIETFYQDRKENEDNRRTVTALQQTMRVVGESGVKGCSLFREGMFTVSGSQSVYPTKYQTLITEPTSNGQ